MRVQNHKIKSKKKYTSSSRQWLLRHLNDPYVQQAKLEGYRSRASYKLLQLQEKFQIFKIGDLVIDLGAAPGGWSQIASTLVKSSDITPQVIALDLLPFSALAGVTIMQGDFCDEQIIQKITAKLAGRKAEVVLSDMAPNTTGYPSVDHLRIMDLCERAYNFAKQVLAPGGHFICKAFQGGAQEELLANIKQTFTRVKHFKPKASRATSSELYLVASGFISTNSIEQK